LPERSPKKPLKRPLPIVPAIGPSQEVRMGGLSETEENLQHALEEAVAREMEESIQRALADVAEQFTAPAPVPAPVEAAPPEPPAEPVAEATPTPAPPEPIIPEPIVVLPLPDRPIVVLPRPDGPIPEPPTAGDADLTEALSSLAATKGTAELLPSDTIVRPYRLSEVSVVLAVFAALMLLLDADGLVTWARRMEVGRVQGFWLSLVTPLQRGLDVVGLNRPRRELVALADSAARLAGAGGDPLFTAAWGMVDGSAAGFGDLDTEPAVAWPTAPDGPLPAAPSPIIPARGPAGVLLIGDSMFVGNLGAAVTTALAKDPDLRVVDAYQTATGLSRPDVFDWLHVAPALLEREQPRLVVCSFGANDAQPIRQGDKLLTFGEPAWEAAYRQRVQSMMRGLTSRGARVLWLGLPPMRDAGLSRRVAHLNRLFARTARETPGTDFLEVGMLLGSADGSYSTFLSNGRDLVRMRMDDGVHYSPAGARTVSRWIVDWVYEQKNRLAATKLE